MTISRDTQNLGQASIAWALMWKHLNCNCLHATMRDPDSDMSTLLLKFGLPSLEFFPHAVKH